MPRPLSNDLRERVVRVVEGGSSRRQAAERFGVSVSFVVKLLQRWQARRSVAPDKLGGGKAAAWSAHAERVRALVAQSPDMTIEQLRRALVAEGVETSRSALGRCLLALGLTRKKRPPGRPSRNARMSPKPGPHGARGR